MARMVAYYTFDVKPGADRQAAEDLCLQAAKLLSKVPGCLEAMTSVGTESEADRRNELEVERVGQYGTFTIWESREALDRWHDSPEPLLTEEMRAQFAELFEEDVPMHHYQVLGEE